MPSPTRIICNLAIAAISFLGLAGAALADPPGRVGRLSYVEGTVSFHSPDSQDWSAAQLNYPISNSNSLWTEADSRAEVQAGDMELVMDESTQLDVSELDDSGTIISVPQGVLNIQIHTLPQNIVQVQTSSGAINLKQPGSYHIDAGHSDPENAAPVQITVLHGEAEVTSPDSHVIIQSGQNAIIGANPPSFTLRTNRAGCIVAASTHDS